jgi:hypothetical protein
METQELQVIKAPEPQEQSVEGLIRCAIDKGASVETLERLMTIRRELKAEAAKEAFERSMAAFQAECPTIAKTKQVMNKDNKTVRYCYAPLEVIIEQVKAILQKHGFNYTLDAKVEGTWVEAICQSTHSMGHSKTSSFKVPIDQNSFMAEAQKFASALTFCKRYAFCNAFGILTGDDDDDAISTHAAEKPAPARQSSGTGGKKFDNSPPPARQVLKPEVAEAWKQSFLKQVKEKGAEVYAYGVAMQLGWVLPGVDKLSDASPQKFPQNNEEKIKVWEKIKALKDDAIQHGGVTQELQEAFDKAYAEIPPPKPASTKEPAAPPNVARSVPPPEKGKAASKPAGKPTGKAIEVPRDKNDPDHPEAPWRSFPMPWGNHAGTPLAKLPKNYLFGNWANYEVTTEYNGKPKTEATIAKDELFRAMLDEAGKHYQFRKDGEKEEPERPRGLSGMPSQDDMPPPEDDDVPF